MSGMLRRSSDLCRGLFVLIVIATSLFVSPPVFAAVPSDIESNLSITIGGAEKQVSLAEAMAALNIPAVSIALIDQDRIAFARAYGDGVTPGHVVPGGVFIEIRRCCRCDAPGRSEAPFARH